MSDTFGGLLTERQAKIYDLHTRGMSYSMIALHLRVTKETVRDHFKKAERKLREAA